jgi:glycosyltransferase involved in cell wall biosynthesis
MRVAVITWSSRRVGGIEEYVSMLIPALHRAGHDVMFWHELDEPQDRERIDVPSGVTDMCAADTGVGPALDALRSWKPDILYAQGIQDPAVERQLLEVAPAVSFLHTYTGTCISGGKTFTRPAVVPCDRTFGWPCLLHYLPHGCGGWSPITMVRQFEQQSRRLDNLRQYRALVTGSAHMQVEMAKHGIDAQVLAFPVRAHTNAGTYVPTDSWRLLFIGRMDRLKGGERLLDALPAVATAGQRPIRLTFAGDGPEREKWQTRAREVMARAPHVAIQFAGWVSQERVGILLSDADLLVVPSLWPEPFGSVGPVAAQCGIPAAAFDVGGISQWLREGISGHLAPADPPTAEGLARVVVRCLEDPAHYASLRKGALEMSAQFTMEQHLSELASVLQDAGANRKGADGRC